jgi:hypothetical protein
VTALASPLQRVWSAKGRLPRLTGRGEPESLVRSVESSHRFTRVAEILLDLLHLARRTAPTVVVIALRILR